jgi:hypothetical protein
MALNSQLVLVSMIVEEYFEDSSSSDDSGDDLIEDMTWRR